jgi:signal transduction histidine kinase
MISKQLCNRLGGDIFVDSEPGKGTKFTFTISPKEIRETTILPNFKAIRSLREIR